MWTLFVSFAMEQRSWGWLAVSFRIRVSFINRSEVLNKTCVCVHTPVYLRHKTLSWQLCPAAEKWRIVRDFWHDLYQLDIEEYTIEFTNFSEVFLYSEQSTGQSERTGLDIIKVNHFLGYTGPSPTKGLHIPLGLEARTHTQF